MRSWRHIPRSVVIAFAVLVALACGNLREDELECEEAVSKLDACCLSGFDSSPIKCTFDQGCGSTTYPDLDEDTSRCIRSESCETIVASGVCERAVHAQPMDVSSGEDAGSGSAATPGVCP